MTNPFIYKLRGFAELDHDDVRELVLATSRAKQLPARRYLMREGDPPTAPFVILEGWTYRYTILPNGSRQVLGYLMPGDSCGLDTRSDIMDHSIHTVTDSLVATVDRSAFNALLAQRPVIARAMHVARLVENATMRAWITNIGRRSSLERVAHLMCELYLRAQNVGLTTKRGLALPLSQLLLADTLGMTAVHLNRVLKELRLDGTMTFHRGNLTIIDPVKLSRIAGFDANYLHRRSGSMPYDLVTFGQ